MTMHNAITGLAAGLIAGTGMVLDEKTLLPIGTAVAIGGLVFWLGRKMQRWEDNFDALGKGQELIHKRLNSLPCKQYLGQCEGEKLNGGSSQKLTKGTKG